MRINKIPLGEKIHVSFPKLIGRVLGVSCVEIYNDGQLHIMYEDGTIRGRKVLDWDEEFQTDDPFELVSFVLKGIDH